jgi:ParB family chromosome partitioning protein
MSENQELAKRPAKKPALGRGLGSLLGESTKSAVTQPAYTEKNEPAFKEGFLERPITSSSTSTPVAEPPPRIPDHARIWQINIADLAPNQKQPRQIFAPEALKELAQSIKEKGVLQPIVARKVKDGQFEIIAGERRWRAAQAAGLHEVPVILKNSADQEALELALIENIQRENLNPIEEAEAYNHLIQTYGLTQQQLADKLGKDRASVANILRLLGLGEVARAAVTYGKITMGHAKVLLAIQDPDLQENLCERIINKKLSVRDLEKEVAQALKPKAQPASSGLDLDVSKKFMAGLSEELQKIVGTRTSIDYDKGKGKIQIHFFSDEQLNSIVERLRGSWRK